MRDPTGPASRGSSAPASIPSRHAPRPLPIGRRQNLYPLISELLRTAFSFTSSYVHEDVASSQREEAAFTLALGTALYGFAARDSLAASAASDHSA